MNKMNSMVALVSSLALMLALAGCASQETRVEAGVPAAGAEPPRIVHPAPVMAAPYPEPAPAPATASRPEEAASAGAEPPLPAVPPRKARPAARPAAAAKAKAAAPAAEDLAADEEDAFAAIDRLIDRMAQANMVFSVPRTLDIKDSATARLLIDLRKSGEELRQEAGGGADVRTVQVKVSRVMEARLTGNGFQVDAVTPEEQPLSSVAGNEWKWAITPTSAGKHQLHLTLNAVFDVNGQMSRRTVRTFDETVEVKVSAKDSVKGFVGNNWQWLWTTIVVPLAGLLWQKRKQGGA